MSDYVATFHTHLAAQRSHRALKALDVQARLAPVPRALSSSCGTCVLYTAEEPHISALDTDVEQVALCNPEGGYTILHHNE